MGDKMKTRYLIGILLLIVIIALVVVLAYHHPNTENNSREVTEDDPRGEVPVVVPGRSHFNQSRFMCPDMVKLSAGETKEVNITLETRKSGPGKVTYNFSRMKRVYSDEEILMPDGLNVSIVPSTFMMYPNETYNSTVTINTSQDLPRGEYALSIHVFFEGNITGAGWLTVNVV